MTRYAIVGGGILGMSLANQLRQAGEEVTLLEAADHLGGLADAWQLADIRWDRHYHVILLSDTYTRELVRELGLEDHFRWVVTKTGFYTDGKLHSLSNSWEFLTFPPLGLLNKFRLAATIMLASRIKDWKSLEAIPVADWLRKWSGTQTFEKIWLPLLRAKLGENYRHTSAAFIWSTIARMYKARRSGMKREMFGYLQGGYGRILDAFQAQLRSRGVEICCSHAVTSATYGAGKWQLSFRDQPPREFDRVIFTTPCGNIVRAVPQLAAAEKATLSAVKYQGIICASLLLRQPLSPYYVTNITDSWVPFTAVIEMSSLVDRVEFGGRSLVYLPKYIPADHPLFEASDEDIKRDFITALKKMHPHLTDDDILAFQLSRVRNVVALPTLNYSQQMPAVETSLPGLYVVNSAQIVDGTLNVNETLRLAEQALPVIRQPLPAAQPAEPCHV